MVERDDERGEHGRDEHGREAERPGDIPKRGWRDVLLRTKQQLDEDNIGIVSAGVAFYAFLSVFPAMTALVSVYGLVADPRGIPRTVQSMKGLLPGEAASLIGQQLERLASAQGGALSVGVIAGLALTIWSAAKGTKALITALNIAYDEDEKRGFLKVNAIALGLVLGGLAVGIVALGVIVAIPIVLRAVSAPSWLEALLQIARWPVLAVVLAAILSFLYRYGPSRDRPRWRWVSAGSGLATVLWLAASIGFSIYVSNFGSYDKMYGTFGAVVILMVWLFLSAYVILLGAEVNAELEHQTSKDTTVGREAPMGRRGAKMADTLGEPR